MIDYCVFFLAFFFFSHVADLKITVCEIGYFAEEWEGNKMFFR